MVETQQSQNTLWDGLPHIPVTCDRLNQFRQSETIPVRHIMHNQKNISTAT